MRIKVASGGEFSVLNKGEVTVSEDVFLPSALAVRGQTLTIRSKDGGKVLIYPQEGEKIDGLQTPFVLAKLCPWATLQASWDAADGEWLVKTEGWA